MKEDVERLYASNVRLAPEAYDLLLRKEVSEAAMHKLLATAVPVLSLSDVQGILSETNKIPMPEVVYRAKEPVARNPAPGSGREIEPAPNEAMEKTGGQKEVPQATPAPENKTDGKEDTTRQVPVPEPARLQTPAPEKTEKMNSPAPEADAEKAPAPPSETGKPIEQEKTQVEVIRPAPFKPSAKEYSPRITIHEHRDVSGQSRCIGSVEDFVSYFRDRYEREAAILQGHPANVPKMRIEQLSSNLGQNARIIVMISDKRITEKGNLWIEAEDESGSTKVFISSREPVFNVAKTVLKDDVVALDGKMMPNFFVAKAITWPDIPVVRQKPKVEEDLAIAYLSDIHIGSRYFLEKPFKRFIRWLHGEEGQEELAGKVKYVIVAGDVVDGIGVYPSQEKELTITDIYEQYAEFDRFVESMPDHVEVIVSPGNHDAVRRGEPQPIIPMELIKTDVKKIGSPSSLDIEGLRHLVYHGTSLDSIIANIGGLSYAKPEGPMLEILKRRHLSPIYGENLIVPELKDYMVIDDEPDVVHMGHVHKNAAMKYRGTLMINSGTFQERTDFQVRMGHIPSPGIVPILELKSGQLSHIKFLEDKI